MDHRLLLFFVIVGYPKPSISDFFYKSYYNPVHNIWGFYKVLIQFPFNSSKTELDILYKKPYIPVASRVGERLEFGF